MIAVIKVKGVFNVTIVVWYRISFSIYFVFTEPCYFSIL